MSRDFDVMDEDDRDSSYYEYMWGGPEDEELEEWSNSQREEEDEPSYEGGEYGSADFDPSAPPLRTPQPGDELGARQHFAALKRRYKAEPFGDSSPVSPLYKILIKIDQGEKLDYNDLTWLRRNRYRGPIRTFATRAALECEERFKTSRDAWDAVQASSFWRMAEKPEKALLATRGLADKSSNMPRLQSAILTTRGGAYRDQKCLDEAEGYGQRAIEVWKHSFHPYMLLGAVYYQTGNPEKGDEYFARARELGAKPTAQEVEIKKAVSLAGRVEQHKVAYYLLKKDPVKYHWAKKYLL